MTKPPNNDFSNAEQVRANKRLELIWQWIGKLNEVSGIKPPDEFFDWFDERGLPITLNDELPKENKIVRNK